MHILTQAAYFAHPFCVLRAQFVGITLASQNSHAQIAQLLGAAHTLAGSAAEGWQGRGRGTGRGQARGSAAPVGTNRVMDVLSRYEFAGGIKALLPSSSTLLMTELVEGGTSGSA